jgi:hypothetical protein
MNEQTAIQNRLEKSATPTLTVASITKIRNDLFKTSRYVLLRCLHLALHCRSSALTIIAVPCIALHQPGCFFFTIVLSICFYFECIALNITCVLSLNYTISYTSFISHPPTNLFSYRTLSSLSLSIPHSLFATPFSLLHSPSPQSYHDEA